ncbi:heat shock 70 kDa protein 6, chloroplastic-like [Brassica napus]|uniref:heat shock 70 kDa protein 6, chloroplastic-like n=1 Tax=Brassica napus TaxID=3708 RepID=UPI002078E72D|nr:heat shock 70 kDa protein 6, chloroplastic-like [Brassica napus]
MVFLHVAKLPPYRLLHQYNLAEKLCYEDYLRLAITKGRLDKTSYEEEECLDGTPSFVTLVTDCEGKQNGMGYIEFASAKEAEKVNRDEKEVFASSRHHPQVSSNPAKRQAVVNPENTFSSVKRFIGRTMNEVDEESKQVSYRVVEDETGTSSSSVPPLVLRKLVDDASSFLDEKGTKAVITVPAYFNDSQRTATKDAGRIAGLEVLRIINEPTAASLAYGFERKSNETILVFDLGGGTFDVSVLEVSEGVFQVLSTSESCRLARFKLQEKEDIDLLKDKQALQRLIEAAEKAKIELSSLTQTNISLPFITATADGPKHIETTLTRAKFEELCSDLLNRCKTPVENSLRDAELKFKDIDEVILVGGSTRIPAVQEVVRKLTGKEPNVTVNPDEVVALGAAVQAGVLAEDVSNIVLLDVTPLSLGTNSVGDVRKRSRGCTTSTRKLRGSERAEGEREFARDNKCLGSFLLDGIPPAPRGVPKIDVKFDIDVNGIFSATATDRATSNKQEITITGATTLPKDEVEKMVKEAERFAKDDKQKREAIDTKNQKEKQLEIFGEKIPGEMKEKIEAKLQV